MNNKVEILENPKMLKVRQLSQYGEFLCDFGYFTKPREEVIAIMIDGINQLYSGFEDNHVYDNNNQWHSEEFEFIMEIIEVELNTLEEF